MVGLVTIGAMLVAPKVTKAVPATIAGLLAGVAAYFLLALGDRSMLVLAGNLAVLGPLTGGGLLEGVMARFAAAGGMDATQLASLVVPALTLAVLLSIDTLKTCVVVDAITRTRHNSNRELLAQGCGNIAATIVGGMPGSGTMGPTVVNISSGAQTRLSGTVEGVASLVAFLVLGSVLAWIPVAALAGILIVVGARMFDLSSLRLLRSRATVLDFAVIVAVVIVAEAVSLIAASATGVGLAIVLFIREQVRGSVVHRQTLGAQTHSKQARLPHEAAVLDREGAHTAIVELQGSLFFGTADQLYTVLEPHLKTRRFLVIDMRRVQSVDVTAAHILELVGDMLRERGGHLLFSALPRNMPGGVDARRYLGDLGFYEHLGAKAFGELDDALEWVEDQILAEAQVALTSPQALALADIDLFRGRSADTLAALAGGRGGAKLRRRRADLRRRRHGGRAVPDPARGGADRPRRRRGGGAPPGHVPARELFRRDGVPGPRGAVGRCGRRARDRAVRVLAGAVRRSSRASTAGLAWPCSKASPGRLPCGCAAPTRSCRRCRRGEGGAGWRRVIARPAVPLRAGTLYVVRMTRPEPHELTVPLRDGSAVSALLLVPAAARAGYVLAHGAGAGMSHPFMTDTAEQLADRGIATFRYQFPYMEGGVRRPDPPRIAQATVRAAVAEAARQLPGIRLFAGGKSFGGRMTSQAQAEAALAGIEGLVFLGFPLHPAKLPSLDRAQHLANVRVPMLFLQGARDSLAEHDLITRVVAALGARAMLTTIPDADHSFHVPARTGRTDAQVLAGVCDAIVAWVLAR